VQNGMTNINKHNRILIVEDNIGHIRLIREAFKSSMLPYELIAVRDGIEAMDFLRQQGVYTDANRPDIILLDLNLPRKDGREVLAEVKTDPNLRRIPILVLTTSTNEEDIQRSYNLHANCYINKSGNLPELFLMVRRISEFWLETVTLPNE
jgi:chemotaxis family two-component system response regulator Rcp1